MHELPVERDFVCFERLGAASLVSSGFPFKKIYLLTCHTPGLLTSLWGSVLHLSSDDDGDDDDDDDDDTTVSPAAAPKVSV